MADPLGETSKWFKDFDASKLAKKQLDTVEPLFFWLYRYGALRIHFSLVALYLLTMYYRPMMLCYFAKDTPMTADMLDHICLYNGTFVARNPNGMQDPRLSSFYSGLEFEDKYTHRESLFYYVNIFWILLFQVCLDSKT